MAAPTGGTLIENNVPVVQHNGLNTNKAVNFGSTLNTEGAVTFGTTLVVTGALTATGGVAGPVSATTLTASGLTKTPNPVYQQTITDLDAQSGTAAIAELLGGIYTHNSKTGAGTLTTPTGAEISAGISGVAVGSTFNTLYYNRGNQTVTITAGASGVTLVGGTAAVTTGKHMLMTFVCTAANTWSVYLQTLM